jgi:hypothetical protein
MTEVRVYRNLHKDCLSVQCREPGKGWRLWFHSHAVDLDNARFVVSEAGRQRMLATGRKNVHAFVIGTLSAPEPVQQPFALVSYNPRKAATFINIETGTPVRQAQRVMVSRRGIYAHGAE